MARHGVRGQLFLAGGASQARARHPSLLQNQARQAGFKADLGPQARQRRAHAHQHAPQLIGPDMRPLGHQDFFRGAAAHQLSLIHI